MSDSARFIAAIRAGDLAGVETALGVDPGLARCRDESGVPVVCLAIYFGREEIARVLARGRDDLDVFEASTLGANERVRALTSLIPALVNSFSPDGFQPLGLACFFGRREAAEALLAAGADLESPARNPMQVRPLHSAVAQSDPDTALFLCPASPGGRGLPQRNPAGRRHASPRSCVPRARGSRAPAPPPRRRAKYSGFRGQAPERPRARKRSRRGRGASRAQASPASKRV